MPSSLVTTRPPLWMFAASILLATGMLWHYVKFFLPQVTARQHTESAVGQRPYLGIDLYQCWIGTRALFHSRVSPYSDEVTRQTQTELYGRPIDHARPGDPKDEHRFPYPLYMVFLMAPFAALPFDAVRAGAFVLWIVLALAGFALWVKTLAPDWHPGWLVIGELLVITSYPVLEAIFAEQLALLTALLLAAAVLAVRRGDLRFAGVMLAIATIKPQLVLLLGIYLFFWATAGWMKRKRLAYGCIAMLALLLVGAEITLPDWTLQWFRTIIAYRTYTFPPLASYLLGALAGRVIAIALIATSVWLSWKFRHFEPGSLEFSYLVAATLAVTVVVFPSADAVYDHVLLLPAVLTLLRPAPRGMSRTLIAQALAILTVVAIFWPWLSASAIVAWSWSRPDLARSEFLSLLPIRTAASIPFALVALLGLRLRAIHSHAQATVA
jgi:hypothetical protein